MKTILWAIPTLIIGIQPVLFADTILPGTEIAVRPDTSIDISHWDRGRIYSAHVARDVFARDGDVAIPRGSYTELIVRQIGPGQYTIDLESIRANGNRYVMDTTGPRYNIPEQKFDNGSGLVGSIIGAIAGEAGEQVEPQGNEIRIPADSVIRFQLQEPLHTVGWGDPGYQDRQYHYHHDHDWYR